MEQQAAEDIVGECSLIRNTLKLSPILWIRLHPQTSRKHELANRRAEAGQERIERVVPDNNAIDKLQRTDCDQEGHEAVNDLHALRGPVQIVLPYAIEDLVCACCVLEVGAGLRATDGL